MSLYPYIDKYPELVTGVIKMYQRMGPYPMDPSTVFETKEDLLEYVNMKGSYAYPGQIVVVTNGPIDSWNPSMYTPYIIKSDKTVQPLLGDLHFNTLEDVKEYIFNNPNTYITNQPFVMKDENGEYGIYTITEQGEIKQLIVSGNTTVDWKNIVNKPTTLEELGISDAVTKEIVHYQTGNNNFMSNVLISQNTYSFRFIGIEIFEDESGIDTNIEDGEYVVTEYLDTENNIINKNDETIKVFLTTPITPNMNIDSLYAMLNYSGEGNITIDVSYSTNSGMSWSSWIELINNTEINYLVTETNAMLRFRITLYGKVVLFGFGIGVI